MSDYKNMGRSGLIEEIKMLSESAEVVDIAFVSVMNENERLKDENDALRKAITDIYEALYREYWSEYAGLDDAREILDDALGRGEKS